MIVGPKDSTNAFERSRSRSTIDVRDVAHRTQIQLDEPSTRTVSGSKPPAIHGHPLLVDQLHG